MAVARRPGERRANIQAARPDVRGGPERVLKRPLRIGEAGQWVKTAALILSLSKGHAALRSGAAPSSSGPEHEGQVPPSVEIAGALLVGEEVEEEAPPRRFDGALAKGSSTSASPPVSSRGAHSLP